MTVADEIKKLDDLKHNGAITEEEFERSKKTLLRKIDHSGNTLLTKKGIDTASENIWAMLIHLSQLLGFFYWGFGLLVPLILWLLMKNDSEVINRHGIIVANWLITALILRLVFILLSLILIGIPLFLILTVLCIIFPVIGAIKAANSELWTYPFSMKFFKY